MGVEIERKFLVKNETFKKQACSVSRICQGYLGRDPERTVRIRVRDEKGYITVKGKNSGAVRLEFEYEVSLADARQMLRMCEGNIVDKTRYVVNYCGFIWEVDEFHNLAEPLTIAEIELPSEDATFAVPEFIGKEVTGDKRYYNSML
ncbi:MAG: CYTH domain-containing protein [Muribaculaceae bacterium]|nr:CYTH domain-containing protein [Muribaculaceae bacterium]